MRTDLGSAAVTHPLTDGGSGHGPDADGLLVWDDDQMCQVLGFHALVVDLERAGKRREGLRQRKEDLLPSDFDRL